MHLHVAQALMKIDEAEFHARRLSGLVDGKSADSTEWKLEERALARADMGMGSRAISRRRTSWPATAAPRRSTTTCRFSGSRATSTPSTCTP